MDQSNLHSTSKNALIFIFIYLFALLPSARSQFCGINPGVPQCPTSIGFFEWVTPVDWCFEDTVVLEANWIGTGTIVEYIWGTDYGEILGPTNQSSATVSGQAMYCCYAILDAGCYVHHSENPGTLPHVPILDVSYDSSYCGLSGGSIDVTITNEYGAFFSYQWSNGAATEDITNLPGGIYTVTIINTLPPYFNNDCHSEFTLEIPTLNDLQISAEIDADNSCTSDNGNINLSIYPPGLPYSYQWSNGSTFDGLYQVAPGNYSVTVTGPSPCMAEGMYTVPDATNPITDLDFAVIPASCDLPNGVIEVTVTGGAPPMDFSWLLGEQTQNLVDVPPGTYYVTVTGDGDCTATGMATVTGDGAPPVLTGATSQNTSCSQPNGSVFLTPSPAGNYTFDWSNGAATQNLSNIGAGTYSVTMTAGSCSVTGSYVVAGNPPPPSLSTTTTPATCGQSSGTATLMVVGGTPPLSYLWSNGTTTQNLSNVAAGVYVVTVTITGGCTTTTSATVQEGFAEVDTTMLSGTSCDISQTGIFEETFTNTNGCDSIVITTISLLQSDTLVLSTMTCDPAQVGTFEETFTNTNGCDSIVITSITFSEADTTMLTGTNCDVGQTGVFEETFTSTNGCDSIVITTVSLLQSDTLVLSTMTCDPTQAGTFEETFTNTNGCDSIVITTISLIQSDTLVLSTMTCDPAQVGTFEETFTNTNGCDSIVITSITFSEADTTMLTGTDCDISQTGFFEETFTSTNGCDSIVITTISLLQSDTVLLSTTSCDPAQTGIFEEIFTNMNGCDSTVITSITFSEADTTMLFSNTCDPSQVGVFGNTLANQFGCDSLILETVTLLSSDTTFLSLSTCNVSEVGTTINVFTNQSGCDSVIVAVTTLSTLPTLTFEISDFSGFGVSCSGGSDGSIFITVEGTAPFTFAWSNGVAAPEQESLPAGEYSVTVSSANGCTATSVVVLQEPPPLQASPSISNPDCFEQNGGSLFIEVTGGVPPFFYSINGSAPQTSSTFTGLPSGPHQLTVADANNCSVEETALINVPTSLDVDLGEDQTIELGSEIILGAVINVSQSSLVSVVWLPDGTALCPQCLEQTVTPFTTTVYSVSIVDANGCSGSDSVTVFVERGWTVYVPNAFSPNGDGINDVFLLYAKPGILTRIKSFLIFDRWGANVWEVHDFLPDDLTHGWDGFHKGKAMGTGVFTWFAEVEFLQGQVEVIEGDVVLIR